MIVWQDQEEEKQRWRRELMASQEQVRAFVTGGSDSHSFRCWSHVAGTHWTLGITLHYRSRPDSFISLESDIASEQEQDRSENVELEVKCGYDMIRFRLNIILYGNNIFRTALVRAAPLR